jgi:hypothetical protein
MVELLGSAAMSQGRQGVVLWSIAGAMLLVAGVFVVVAMRPSSHTAPVAPRAEEPADVAAAPEVMGLRPTLTPLPVAPPPRIGPPAVLDPRVLAAPEEPMAEGEAPAAPPPQPEFIPVMPPTVGALRDVRLAVPMADVLGGGASGARGARASVPAQRLDGMEGIVAGQEAEIRRLEASLAEAERIGDIDDARLRRGRLAQMRRVHGGLEKQLVRMRAEAASATNAPPADAPARTPGDVQ